MLIRNARTIDDRPVALRVDGDRITQCATDLAPTRDDVVVDLRGGTVLPGLHDHHLHLRSAAAALESVHVGPPAVTDEQHLRAALADAVPGTDGWLRAVGYHESVAGDLDRRDVDRLRCDVPIRIQHRSGAQWSVNSAGLELLGLGEHPTGRLFRQDTMFRGFTDRRTDLAPLSARLRRLGVTGVTEATPDPTDDDLTFLDDEAARGTLTQRVHVLGRPVDRSPREFAHLSFGSVKRILDDTDLDLDRLTRWIAAVHADSRGVALHCVTVAQLVVAVTALRDNGVRTGDRIEHAALVPDDLIPTLAELGVLVVTQPNFVAERGEEYLRDVPRSEHGWLWRLTSLIDARIPVAGSTDAPFGGLDPWAAMRAARDRRSPAGIEIGRDERMSSRRALSLFLGHPERPWVERTVGVGAPADLCLLSGTPRTVLHDLSADLVAGTVCRGVLALERGEHD